MSYQLLMRKGVKDNEAEPVWRTRAYIGEFADPYVFRTSLEGGQTGPSLLWTSSVLKVGLREVLCLLSFPATAPSLMATHCSCHRTCSLT